VPPEELAVIPTPRRLEHLAGCYTVAPGCFISVSPLAPESLEQADRFAGWLGRATGFCLPVTADGPEPGGIRIHLLEETGGFEDESYELTVRPNGVELRARSAAGIHNGLQTFRQLLPPEIEAAPTAGTGRNWSLPAVRIEDGPICRWRGLLLDCCRHFIPKPLIKKVIATIARYKLNRFHWHLTEDQGWRLEVRRFPRLTEVGAWRQAPDGTVHGGYYTHEDVREIVAFAAERAVTVVPEIEMPGHCRAALAAYPELSCRGRSLPVPTEWGIFEDVFCLGSDEVLDFLQEILVEVMELFPGRVIHCGGDECPPDRWRECPRCRKRLRAEGLREVRQLQGWFTGEMARLLQRYGRRLAGWDEILAGPVPPGAIVQAWQGSDAAVAAARAGHEVIHSPTSSAYFDYPLEKIDLETVFGFDPIPTELVGPERDRILGGECNLWTERAPADTIESKLFPRLLAMAERLWSPRGTVDYSGFREKVRRHYRRLDLLGIRYGPEGPPG
jgi:hexosaminidase